MTVDEPSEFGLRVSPTPRASAMTEAEWANCEIPQRLVEQLHGRVGLTRKRRLFLCGCARALFPSDAGEVAAWIDTAERFSDGLATHQERQEANRLARARHRRRVNLLGFTMVDRATLHDASHANLRGAVQLWYHLGGLPESRICDLIRDVFGNPFRPVAFDPTWRTSTAVAMARHMYDAREFSAMPILADALQDAGCENADVLDHCRGPGPHVRGCWVVDHVLGKA